MGGIFISYRRGDSGGYAGRLSDNLREHFGRDQVFMDIEAIEFGADFVEALNKSVSSCTVLIAIIGPTWATLADAAGNRKLEQPTDYTRVEVGAALERKIRVIPVLVQDAVMPKEEELPEDLKALSRRQALALSNERWDYDVGRLIEVLEKDLGMAPSSVARRQKRGGQRGKGAGAALPLKKAVWIMGTLVILGGLGYWGTRPHNNKTVHPVSEPAKPGQPGTSQPSQGVAPPAASSAPAENVLEEPRKQETAPAPLTPPATTIQPYTPAPAALHSLSTSRDGSNIIIVGPSGQEKEHISLDPGRVAKIFRDPNGKWGLVVFEVRNQRRYGLVPIDLVRGRRLRSLAIPSLPESVSFEGNEAVVSFATGETRRISLR